MAPSVSMPLAWRAARNQSQAMRALVRSLQGGEGLGGDDEQGRLRVEVRDLLSTSVGSMLEMKHSRPFCT